MPTPKGTQYGVKKTSKGNVRLAFDSKGKVIEAKNLKTGKTHTQAEFKADKKKANKKDESKKHETKKGDKKADKKEAK